MRKKACIQIYIARLIHTKFRGTTARKRKEKRSQKSWVRTWGTREYVHTPRSKYTPKEYRESLASWVYRSVNIHVCASWYNLGKTVPSGTRVRSCVERFLREEVGEKGRTQEGTMFANILATLCQIDLRTFDPLSKRMRISLWANGGNQVFPWDFFVLRYWRWSGTWINDFRVRSQFLLAFLGLFSVGSRFFFPECLWEIKSLGMNERIELDQCIHLYV